MSRAVEAAEADYTVNYDEEETENLEAVNKGNNNTKYASKVNCRKKNCGHTVIFQNHFLPDEWEAVVEALASSAGACEYCSEDVKKIRGRLTLIQNSIICSIIVLYIHTVMY